jgi:glutamine synthetase
MTQTISDPDLASTAELELRAGIDDGSLREMEVAWSDPFGHAAGKRIPAAAFLDRGAGHVISDIVRSTGPGRLSTATSEHR